MEKRKAKLQLFLTDLLKHPLLQTSEIVMNFLTTENEKEFEKIRKDFDKVARPKEVDECVTLEGNAKISFDEDLEKNSAEIHAGIHEIYDEFKKYFSYSLVF